MKHFSLSPALSVTASSHPHRAEGRKNIGEVHICDLSLTFIVVPSATSSSQFILPLVDFERQPSELDRCVVACIVSLWLNTGGLLFPTQPEFRNVLSVYITHMIHKHSSTNGPSTVSLVGPRWASFFQHHPGSRNVITCPLAPSHSIPMTSMVCHFLLKAELRNQKLSEGSH